MAAQLPSTISSGVLTVDMVVLARPGKLRGILISNTGAIQSTVVLYDNASSAAGTELCQIVLATTEDSMYMDLPNITCNNGIFADKTGSGVDFIVYYS